MPPHAPTILAPTRPNILHAASILRNGGVVALPTETVYGLGGCTLKPRAIEQIYALKGRPMDNPLIAHVLDLSCIDEICTIEQTATRGAKLEHLATRFWPGPLTLILPKNSSVPSIATAGLNTVAVRSPAHSVARELLQQVGSAISAPSANRSGHVSPTSAEHVAADFADSDLVILDGGACQVGIESTVLDLTSHPPRILRPGTITLSQLQEVLGEVAVPQIQSQAASPGTASQHYAPRTPAELVPSSEIRSRLSRTDERIIVLAISEIAASAPHRVVTMPSEPKAYAQQLYGSLRHADSFGGDCILIEQPPMDQDNEHWSAIRDRLRRATAKTQK